MSDALTESMTASLTERFPGARVEVQIDGNRALVAVEATEFEALSRVKRQQAVYAVIGHHVTDGTLHAVTIQARVPA